MALKVSRAAGLSGSIR